jgi:hypothetical protein
MNGHFAHWNRSGRGPLSHLCQKFKKKKLFDMETLIFAFIAVRHFYSPQETVFSEAPQLPPFDLQSLGYVYGATERPTNRPVDRNDSHLAQALS